jgi:hypothetical protein
VKATLEPRLVVRGEPGTPYVEPMLAVFWNFSAALHDYMRCYMPTNRAIDWLRTPARLRWAIPSRSWRPRPTCTPCALALVSSSAVAPGYLNVLLLLFAWNAIKFACTAVIAPICMLRSLTGKGATRPARTQIPTKVRQPSANPVRHRDGGTSRGSAGRTRGVDMIEMGRLQ